MRGPEIAGAANLRASPTAVSPAQAGAWSARFGGRGSVLRAGLDPRLRGGRGPGGPIPFNAVAPRWAFRDSRDEPENDSVGGAGFRKVIAGRRLGPVFVRALPVPITVRAVEEHPERCAGALQEAHENAQYRLQRKLDERWVAWAVCAVSCQFHAWHYKSANTPADLAPRFPSDN